MPPTSVLAARHGQSTWNAEGRWQGQADAPLSDLGRRQARAASAAVGAVDVVVASDLGRAQETAAIIAAAIGVGPVVTLAGLRETDAGPWTGLTRPEIEAHWPGWRDAGRRPEGFEPWKDVGRRARVALFALHADHGGARVLAITHAGVIRAVERLSGVDDDVVPNLGGRRFEVTATAVTVGERVLLIDPRDVAVTAPTAL